MARIKLDLPEIFNFQTEMTIRITDLNYGNHLANDKLLGIIHEARVRFFKSFNCSEMNIFGSSIIMSDSAIIYKSQGFYNDQLLIEIAVEDISKFGCDILYKITNKATKAEVAKAKTGILFFNYETQKLTVIPDQFKSMFSNQSQNKIYFFSSHAEGIYFISKKQIKSI